MNKKKLRKKGNLGKLLVMGGGKKKVHCFRIFKFRKLMTPTLQDLS